MGSYYDYPPINTSPITWSPHLPSFSSSDPQPDFTLLTEGTGLHELHDNSSSGAAKADDYYNALARIKGRWVNCYTQPDFTHLMEGIGLHELQDNISSGAAKADDYYNALARIKGRWVNCYPQPDSTRLTEDIGLHELLDNISSGAAKADDYYNALARVKGRWVNCYTQPDFTRLTEGTGLHELHDNSSSRAAKADDEHLGGSWVNISDAGIINKPTDDGGLNKPFDGGNKPTDTLAAWNTSWEKETGAGVGAGGYHTCEELSGSGYRARGSCGNACYTCGDADHFARKCSLGADF